MPKITGSAAPGGRNAIASTNAALMFLIPRVKVRDTDISLLNLNSLDRKYPVRKPKHATRRLTNAMRI